MHFTSARRDGVGALGSRPDRERGRAAERALCRNTRPSSALRCSISDFSFEKGELTYTMKLKRRVIDDRYRDVIERLYSEDEDRRPIRAAHPQQAD